MSLAAATRRPIPVPTATSPGVRRETRTTADREIRVDVHYDHEGRSFTAGMHCRHPHRFELTARDLSRLADDCARAGLMYIQRLVRRYNAGVLPAHSPAPAPFPLLDGD